MSPRLRVSRFIAPLGGAILAMTVPSSAEVCYSAFGGNVHFQFSNAASAFTTAGVRNVAGVVFGNGFAACSRLNQWPLTGTVDVNSGKVILGFSASFADKTTGCGNVDFTARLLVSGGGVVEFHNNRQNFSGSSAIISATCLTLPAPPTVAFSAVTSGFSAQVVSKIVPPIGVTDVFGNGGK